MGKIFLILGVLGVIFGGLIALISLLLLSGCSTIGGWFSSEEPLVKPAPLVAFSPSIELIRTWDAQVGAAGAYTFSPDTDGEAVYAAGREGKLVKLDLASGELLAKADAGVKRSLSGAAEFAG